MLKLNESKKCVKNDILLYRELLIFLIFLLNDEPSALNEIHLMPICFDTLRDTISIMTHFVSIITHTFWECMFLEISAT